MPPQTRPHDPDRDRGSTLENNVATVTRMGIYRMRLSSSVAISDL